MAEFVNYNTLESFTKLMGDMTGEIINEFINDNKKQIKKLKFNLKSFNSEDVLFIAHSLKGSCAMFGAEKLVDNCIKLENSIKINDISTAKILIKKVCIDTEKVNEVLINY